MRGRWHRAALQLTFAALLLAGCGASRPADPQRTQTSGGTMILLSSANWGSADPALNYTVFGYQLESVMYDGLAGFQRAAGIAGTRLVPDLAASLPSPTDGGRTYSFKLRSGIRYSDGQPVRASDFVTVIRRQFTVPGPANSFYTGIVGAARCASDPARCDLSAGVVANDRTGTVTFHLTAPDPEFLDKLALPFAAAVPGATPARSTGFAAPPGTGPYVLQSYEPDRQAVLVRNRYFRVWSGAAQPDGYPNVIDVKIGLTPDEEVSQIEDGYADWMADQPPTGRMSDLSTIYGTQLHVDPQPGLYYMALNVNLRPFNNVDARRAISYAVNREADVGLYGGPTLAVPSCQVLPPDFPGYAPYCPYTVHPSVTGTWVGQDLATARRLVAASGTAGAAVTVYGTTDTLGRSITFQLVQTLDSIGYHAKAKLLGNGSEYSYIQNSRNRVQVGYSQWYEDFPAASDFLNVLLGCGYFHRGSDASPNISGFCDRGLQKLIAQASRLEEQGRTAAADQVWAAADRRATDLAPIVTLFNPKLVDFVSARVQGYEYDPVWGFLFDLASVR